MDIIERIELFLNERYVNAFSTAQKEALAPEVWAMLQLSYAPIGGIKGSGFSSIDDMIKSIPMWKVERKNGVLIACILYKDTNGRKLVAAGTNGTQEGKQALKKMMLEEFKTARSYGEISSRMLTMCQRMLGDSFTSYLIPGEKAVEILKQQGKDAMVVDNKSSLLFGYEYARKLGSAPDEDHIKVMFGKPGQKIT